MIIRRIFAGKAAVFFVTGPIPLSAFPAFSFCVFYSIIINRQDKPISILVVFY